jgi:3-oxoacyl-[acyl-carrier protein] reductase
MDDALAIAGRVAIVTGAGNGLGRAESLALARAGALLVLNDLPGDAVQAVADEIAADGGQAVVAAGDVADWATGEKLLATALERYGRLDILVNNAGVLRDRMVFTMSPDEWDLVIRVHLRGHFVTTRLATAYWREQRNAAGHPVYARIVNTSSEAFLLGSVGQPNYAAAKAGIAALTVTTARSCSRYGVRANAICPRARTAMTAELMGPAPADAVDPLAGARRAAGGVPGRPGGRDDQRRGVRGARRRGRGDGPATGPFGIPGRGHAGRDVDPGRGGRRARPCFRGRGFRGPGALGRVLVRGHARAGHRDHRVRQTKLIPK